MSERGSVDVHRQLMTIELDGDLGIVFRRTFNGPARIVFDAWTKPELVQRWWAPAGLGVSMVSCEADVRVGGAYRYVIKARGNPEMAFSGIYKELTPPTRLVHTQVFEPTASGSNPDDGELVVTVTFEEEAGRTRVTSRAVAPTKEVRDAIVASGMESGARMTWDQLDELVAELDGGRA